MDDQSVRAAFPSVNHLLVSGHPRVQIVFNQSELRELRDDLRLTQWKVGRILDVSQPTVSRVEAGNTRVNLRTRLAVLGLLIAAHRA